MVKSDIETSSAKWIPDTPLFVGGEDDKRNRCRTDGSKFWDAQLPIAEHLEKQSLELLIDFVDLVDEKHTGFPFVQQRAQQRTFCEEFKTMKLLSNCFPIAAELICL